MDKDYIVETETGVDVTLRKPVMIDGVPVSVISMREPTVQDQLAMDAVKGGDAMKETTLVANLCMLTTEQLRAMPLRDYKRLQEALVGFLA